ncbi:histidine phosphatase family protein (plasmid) [Rhizobium sp. CB3171]|uniref:histidine phosphatase family protein n=1 Tax=Rhizobium sp. CB3171 TaxID=3039157 RepID=UPI0024B06294|nr:histidine phosphatase family protein [Rhizobium sp. CB3171]WFU04533.1 histidine phosphatase family protein [Rhizobium sp. CB3171]
MAPRKIMIIRHAERPGENSTDLGVDLSGTQDDSSLIVRGWQRAGALVRFFAPEVKDEPTEIEQPTALFAARPTEKHPSNRTALTLQPLSQLLNININTEYRCGDETTLAAAVQKETGVVLIAWEHNAIPIILEGLIALTNHAPKWPDDRFDMVYVLKFEPQPTLIQIPQNLLPGDQSTTF